MCPKRSSAPPHPPWGCCECNDKIVVQEKPRRPCSPDQYLISCRAVARMLLFHMDSCSRAQCKTFVSVLFGTINPVGQRAVISPALSARRARSCPSRFVGFVDKCSTDGNISTQIRQILCSSCAGKSLQ